MPCCLYLFIPVGLNDLGFRLPNDHLWHLDGAPLSFFYVCLCVMMALHLPMNLCASIPIEGGVVLYASIRLWPELSVQDTRTRLPTNAVQVDIAITLQVTDPPTGSSSRASAGVRLGIIVQLGGRITCR